MNRKIFAHRESLEIQLVDDILAALEKAIQARGEASILFSGGSTPKGMLARLTERPFDWSAVKIGLVDDRMVETTSEYSNAKMINELLISRIKGVKPQFFPLVYIPADESLNFDDAMSAVVQLGTPDVAILGMGGDGHFASLFPNDECSTKGLSEDRTAPLIYTHAPVEPKNRISYSWSLLRRAKHLYLHIAGEEKLKLIDAQEERLNDLLPIDTVLNDQEIEPVMYWAP